MCSLAAAPLRLLLRWAVAASCATSASVEAARGCFCKPTPSPHTTTSHPLRYIYSVEGSGGLDIFLDTILDTALDTDLVTNTVSLRRSCTMIGIIEMLRIIWMTFLRPSRRSRGCFCKPPPPTTTHSLRCIYSGLCLVSFRRLDGGVIWRVWRRVWVWLSIRRPP